jgi:hypothetical protein
MAGMETILRAVPWWVYPLLLLAVTVINLSRSNLGKELEIPSIEEIKSRYRAKIFPLRFRKKG